MNVGRIAILVGLIAAVPGGRPAFGHGASKGLHVHVDPERASPGEVVTVSLDASQPIANVRIGVTGEDAVVEVAPDPPARRLETTVSIPDAADGVVNVHAEARTVDGSTVRAAAVVTIQPRQDAPRQQDDDG